MEKPWLRHYPPGMPAEVNIHEFSSLKDVLEQACERFAALPAYTHMGVSITYRELEEHSRHFAGYLQKALRLNKGDRLAIMLPNLLQYPVALFGALRAGLVVVNVNPMYTPRELEHQLKDSGASAVVVLENFARTLEEVLPRTNIKTVITTEVGDMFPVIKELVTNMVVKYVKHLVPEWHILNAVEFNKTLREGKVMALDDLPLNHSDVALLQYTGGTTGVAKGAVLTHGNLVANLQQVAAWVGGDLLEGQEVAIIPLPLFHIYALTSSLVFLKIGANTVLITNPRDLPAFVAELKTTRFTACIGVNTLYAALLDAPGFAEVDTGALKLASAGGMAMQRTVAERWKNVTGVPIVEGYGLTETAPVAISNPLNIRDWTGNIGMPIPSTEVAVLDDRGHPVGHSEVGEICIRGPQVMTEYWQQPEETAKVFTADGWFKTGDMGCMDERGHFKITDRKKDMIIVSGFKVFPNEVEDVVMMHPGVLEVAAVGAPDDRSGEVVRIVVVKKDQALTEQALLDHCKAHLTGYKIPKIIDFRNEPLPKTHLGKILRRELREQVTA